LSHDEILARLNERFGAAVQKGSEAIDFTVYVEPSVLVEVARFLRDELGFDFLSNLTAVDWPEHFAVVYHLYSTQHPAPPLVLKVLLHDKENPRLPSVVQVWEGANFQEREVYDLMGIMFEGHPNLQRILLWDGFPGHPLRKSFVNRTFAYEEMEPTLPPPEQR
jgi:NADH/F420H2 dehydrogenase subunit C